jgi:UDP-glucuronate 4-epimerase
MIVLVTGAAGFIGFHTVQALLRRDIRVIGIDSLNSYYDVGLKQARLAQITAPHFSFHRIDISDREAVEALTAREPDITHIVHLAAQAGVRYSMQNPYAYVQSNVMGHVVMLEAAKRLNHLRHFVYASSSSVYGLNRELPFDEAARVDTPSSLYAATKRADELISHAYSHLYALPQTGLRFFTVYGPWGRPDMAYYLFARALMDGKPITLYEGGTLKRDFTYIDDIVAGVLGVMEQPPPADAPRVLNIGNNRSEYVSLLVELLERELGRKAVIRVVPRPAADVPETWASVDRIGALAGYAPTTPLEIGIPRFAAWFRAFERAGDPSSLRGMP